MKSNAAVSGKQIVAKEKRGTVIGCDKHIQIAVTVEVAIGKSASDSRLSESLSDLRCHFVEAAVAVQKQLRSLRIADAAANITHGVVYVSVDHQQILRAVKIGV